MKASRLLLPLTLAIILLGIAPLPAETETTQAVADRYEQLLVRTPQAGAPLDRVIDWYSADGGGLDGLQKRWKASAESDPANRRSYLILQGLLAERLRRTADARALYTEALAMEGEKLRAAKPLAALEATEGNFEAAAAAYKQALAVESLSPIDRLELMRSLALLYQRAFDSEKALSVWRDAVAAFPEDQYVLEEAGEAFLTAGEYPDANKTFTRLREVVAKDPFLQIAASLRLARTLDLQGKTSEAVDIYLNALSETSEGSWINREVRAQIESLFRRKDDLPGLLSFYEKRMGSFPQDYMSLLAQASVLEDLGRADDALECTRNAAKLAPDNLDLRLGLIRRLSAQGKTDEALAEAAAICKPADAPVRALVTLGNLNWTLYTQNKDEKSRAEALAAWRRIAPDDSRDISRISQLAEILTAHELDDDAFTQWDRIVTLAPDLPEPRQRLAEIQVKRGDKTAAAKILGGLVEGDRAQAANFVTLVRLQERLELTELARESTGNGLELFPDNFDLLNLAWRQASEAKDAEAVAKLFPALWKNSPSDFYAGEAEKKYVLFLDSAGKGKETAEKLAARLQNGESLTPAEAAVLFRLAVSQQNEGTAKQALAAIKAQNDAVRTARLAYDFSQAFGSADDQIAALEELATAEPRMAGESLRAAARIQADTGRTEAALKTIAQLLDRTPGDVSLYILYSEIAARAGKSDDAVERLRKAIRYVDDTTTIRLQLATLLDAQGRTADAARLLQEAFEAEQAEGRRMEIFRRQIEIAMRAGAIDTLIAGLREKQLREQGGARYGTYLAEIFILQGDLLAAREELTRSLGRSPDNPPAVSKLLDLAERGGDQEEALRLSKKLSELAPSAQNRASYLAKLFEAGESAAALTELDRVRSEILQDPMAWSPVLTSMRKIGLDQQCDAIVAEIAGSASPGIPQFAEVARLRLMQRDYPAAEESLLKVITGGDLTAALTAVASDAPSNMPRGYPQYWVSMIPFQQLAGEAQNALQQIFQQNRGYYSVRSGLGFTTGAGKATPEQREQIRALFTLSLLADSQGQSTDFFAKLNSLLTEQNTPRRLRLILLRALNDTNNVAAIIREQADDPNGDLETDRFIVTSGQQQPDPTLKDVIDRITARVRKADPKFDFEQTLSEISQERTKLADPKSAESLAKLREKVSSLLDHPGLAQSPQGRLQIASLAAYAGDFPLAFRLCDEVAAAQPASGTTPVIDPGIGGIRGSIIAQAILANEPSAPARLEEFLKAPNRPANQASVFYGPMGMGLSRSQNQLAQVTTDLVAGDSSFPVSFFRQLTALSTDSAETARLQKWFVDRAASQELDIWNIGAFYAEWFAGKREAAVKRIEALYAQKPTPRTAALLFEAYEKLNQADKALALAETAALQEGETNDVRNLRVVRLLRSAGKTTEATALAERLARGRVSYAVRDQLSNELNLLGVPPNKYSNLSLNSMNASRGSRDRSEQLRTQVNKLVTDKKTDEAERIAVQFLQRPLPSRQDYQEMNARQNLMNILKSMGRLERLQASLQERLTKNPGDLDAAIRYAETNWNEDSPKSAAALLEAIKANPRRVPGLSYAFQLLSRGGDTRASVVEAICAMIRANPDYLAASGMQFYELMNFSSAPESGLIMADTIASLSDKDYARLFYPSRLTRDLGEIGFSAQLAEFSAKAGKNDQAIALLLRSRPQAMQYLDAGLSPMLRLAELQLAKGDKAGATETMKALVESKSQRTYAFGYGPQSLLNVFSNLMMNNMRSNGGTDLITRTARLAEETGMFDQLLASLETPTPNSAFPVISPSLQIRTILKRPEVVKEWRAIASSKQPPGVLSSPMLSVVIPLLAEQKDAKELVPSLLRKIPEGSFYRNADYCLAALAETLPLLTAFQQDPSTQKFINMLISQAMSDPNGPRNLIFSENYPRAILALIAFGQPKDAQKLLDLTASERSAQNYGNQNVFRDIENRLAAANGKAAGVDVICAGFPIGPDRLRVHWQASVRTESASEDNSVSYAIWAGENSPIPKSIRPLEIEILAGPNPAALEKVGNVSNPGSNGSLEIKVKQPLGLLMARWKLPDGSTATGPLTAYVLGDNVLPNNGVPDQKPASEAFKTGLPGPTGEKSAVRYQTSSPTSQVSVDLGAIAIDNTPSFIVFTGWIQTDQSGRMAPRPEFQKISDKGRSENDSVYLPPAGTGQWRQVVKIWSSNTKVSLGYSTLNEGTTQIKLRMNMNAYSGYNSQYAISGSWDGLQFLRLPFQATSNLDEARKLLDAARNAVNKKEFKSAADSILSALPLDPYTTLQQSPATLVDAFKYSGRLGELFARVSAPALFLPNPLRNNQPVINNPGLIDLLAREALARDAQSEAKKWLAQIQEAPLDENLRFIIQAATVREAASSDPAKADVAEVLSTLGFRPKALNRDRLRRIWYLGMQDNPTQSLLKLLDSPEKIEQARTLLSAMSVPVDLAVSKTFLEAWLLAPTDPGAALTLFNQATDARYGGPNSVSLDDTADRALLLRIAASHPKSGDVVAALNSLLTKARSDENYRQRRLVELLYALAKSDSPQGEEYAILWADAELAAMKSPGYSPSRDRVRELSSRLVTASQWDRLDELITATKTNSSLANDPIQREFAQFHNRIAFGKGDYSIAWPVVWCSPGTDSREVTVSWQWNLRDVDPNQGDYDTAISLAAKPIAAKVTGQQSLEVFFGELASAMQSLGKVEGEEATGSLKVTLPSGNGFLRAVSTLNGKSVAGPLTPVVSGHRVYPPDSTTLKDLLASGSETIAPDLISDAGTAPDGSPALRIGKAGSGRRMSYAGPAFSVTPGKFYVSRAWIRRTGSGAAVLSSEFKAVKTSTKGSLNMLLTEDEESPDQWVLYTRAVPAVGQHTFWIPPDEIDTMTPRMWNMEPGTEIAAFELIEIEGWKYGEWIVELAALRKQSGETPDGAAIERAAALAAIEPLTSMDYHGDWLGQHLPKAGKEAELLDLFRRALAAEPNPLFSRPKLGRIFNYMTNVLNRGEGTPAFRADLAQLGLDHGARMSPALLMGFQSRLLALASPDKREALLKAFREDATKKISDPAGANAYLKSAITERKVRDDRPINECLNLLTALDDPALNKLFLEAIRDKRADGVEPSDKIFATIALEAAQADAKADEKWNDQVTRGFQATEKSNSPDAYMRWPAVLADYLTARNLAPETVLKLRRLALERVLKAKPEDGGRLPESLRAGSLLIETGLAQKDPAAATEAITAIVPIIQAGTGKIPEDSLRILLKSINLLASAQSPEQVTTLVSALDPDIRRFPKMLEAYGSYLKPVQ